MSKKHRKPWLYILGIALTFATAIYSFSLGHIEGQRAQIGRTPTLDHTVCVQVVFRDAGRTKTKYGVGFLINRQGYIVTAKHVVKGMQGISVKLVCDSEEVPWEPADTVVSSSTHDIAVIKMRNSVAVDSVDCHPVIFARESTVLYTGIKVEMQGWPCSDTLDENLWMCGDLQVSYAPDSMTISAYPNRKCSGAGIFLQETGVLIGCQSRAKEEMIEVEEPADGDTVWVKHRKRRGFVFFPYTAVHFKQITDLLQKNGIPFTQDTSKAN